MREARCIWALARYSTMNRALVGAEYGLPVFRACDYIGAGVVMCHGYRVRVFLRDGVQADSISCKTEEDARDLLCRLYAALEESDKKA